MKIAIQSNITGQNSLNAEIVERKGIGHPDTLSDGLAERISNAYSSYTLRNFGAVLHHNVDKLGIHGGHWRKSFEGLERLKPVRVELGGRMSSSFGSKSIPVMDLQEQIAKEFLGRIVPPLSEPGALEFYHGTTDYSSFSTWYRPRSLEDVPDHFRRWANDTSVAVAFSSFSAVEQLTLGLERYFYQAPHTPRFDFAGTDIKVMAVRLEQRVDVTVCVPMLMPKLSGMPDYHEKRLLLQKLLQDEAGRLLNGKFKYAVRVNTQDESTIRKTSYLTATGSCVEFGEEGYVGRGNSHSGLISSMRPHSMEACFGKNPVYHVGKVGAFLAKRIADTIRNAFGHDCYVIYQANNGDDLFDPSKIIIGFYETVAPEANKLKPIVERVLKDTNYTGEIINDFFVPKAW